MDLTLRPYRHRDRDPVWRVHDYALRDSNLGYDPEYNRYLRHVEREFFDAGGEFVVGTVSPEMPSTDAADVAVDDGWLVAIGGYQPLDALPAADHPPAFDGLPKRTARIRSVAVLPAAQGRGIGSRLVDHLENEAQAAGFETIVLSSVAEMTGARAFWADRGYERFGETGVSGTGSVWFRTEC